MQSTQDIATRVAIEDAVVRMFVATDERDSAVSQGLKTRIFVGTYEIALRYEPSQWLITELKFLLKFIDGNPNLEG
jgi:hypothetical protein